MNVNIPKLLTGMILCFIIAAIDSVRHNAHSYSDLSTTGKIFTVVVMILFGIMVLDRVVAIFRKRN